MGLPPLVRQSQARRWNRIRHNFPQSQGPVARRGFRPATQILRAGTFLPGPRGNPRNGGPGVSRHWRTKFASAASPGDPLVPFPSLGKEPSPQGGTLPPPAGGEILPVKRTSQRPDEGIGPYKNHSIIAPSSAPFGGTFPPRGRLLGEPPPSASGGKKEQVPTPSKSVHCQFQEKERW